jgi:glycosyltransferase 2 family protein
MDLHLLARDWIIIMEVIAKTESRTSKLLKLLLKIAVTVVCFWYISTKIDFREAYQAVLNANWGYLLLAVLSFMFSKLLASFRLNINFRNIGIRLPQWTNIKLYWLGMYYNLFLPGSISGDAYKVILLTRKYNVTYKKTTAAVLLDRFSGLLALGIILSIYGVLVLDNKLYDTILIAGAVAAVIALYIVVRFLLKDFLPGFLSTFLWGLAVQTFQVVCVYCVLLSLNLDLRPEWIFIFLVASVISVIPISLGGGLGTRELVFVEGARYFQLDEHLAVVISLFFYLSNVLSSIWGLYFVFHDPFKEQKIKQEVQTHA